MQSHNLMSACQLGWIFELRLLILESIMQYIGHLIVWDLCEDDFFFLMLMEPKYIHPC